MKSYSLGGSKGINLSIYRRDVEKLNIPNFTESVSLVISQLENKCMVYCFPL